MQMPRLIRRPPNPIVEELAARNEETAKMLVEDAADLLQPDQADLVRYRVEDARHACHISRGSQLSRQTQYKQKLAAVRDYIERAYFTNQVMFGRHN